MFLHFSPGFCSASLFMGRVGAAQAAKLVLRGSRQFQVRQVSKAAEATSQASKSGRPSNKDETIDGGETGCWVPHPRSGIFFPAGQEQVMDDVPDSAASFDITFWLRNVDGVDKPDPDLDRDHDRNYIPLSSSGRSF